jgi:predicted esterase
VWISAGENGRVMGQWKELLIKHKLLWVGANGAGNPRAMWCRAGLALDAAHMMKQRYKIDPARVYVAGFSGGGRMSSMVGVAYPDVFAGGMYMGGCNFYRDMPVPITAEERQAKEPQKYWRGTYKPPPLKYLTDAKKKSRHVLVTGENDPNRPQAKFNYQNGFKKDGFLNVLDIEVPGIGHQPPSNEWVEKAMAFLDERPAPAGAPATRPATKPVVAPKR